jgi:energy-coupling factor transporter transmembrane protein EcfT
MEAAGHLVFMLIKIAIQASVYALLIIAAISFLAKFLPTAYLKNVVRNKRSSWLGLGFILSTLLLIYSFTYWGNHGLGDSARVPVGYGYAVDNINWQWSSLKGFQNDNGGYLSVSHFLTSRNTFCGKFDKDHFFYDYENAYFVLDMRSEELQEFATKEAYNKYAIKNNLPLTEELRTFEENYRHYFGGWRFWLLP